MRRFLLALCLFVPVVAVAQPAPAPGLAKSKNLGDLPSPATARSNLSLGTAATVNTGTSGSVIPLLSQPNTWSAAQGFGANAVSGSNFGITGGTIDGVTIGGSTPGSGSFTGLSTSGVATLGSITSLGNLVVSPANTSSVVNFKATSSGSSIVQIGGTNSNVNVQTQLQLNGRAWSGASATANAAIYENSTWSGTSSNNIVFPHILQSSENITAGTSELDFLYVHDTATSGFSGNRHALLVQQDISGSPSTAGGTYTAINAKINLSANLGGTGLTDGTSAGWIYGENPVAHAASGATYLAQVVGGEDNVWTETGSSMMDRIGRQVVLVTGSNVAGVRDDVAYSINNQFRQNSGSAPWAVGISFGRQGGFFPISTTGTLIKVTPNISGDSTTAANGIDISAATFTGNTWNDGHVTISGAGLITAPKIVVTNLPTSCSGQASGTLWSSGGAVNVCP